MYRCLRQILNETLRLTAIISFSARYSDDDIIIGGYHVPAGTPIIIALGILLKSKKIWQDAEKYVILCNTALYSRHINVCAYYVCIYH